jgi:hypothetical protein|tara:strand:+ start:100 stop:399 length:300 start_codon:yes stop_codon:yes gene_type:complete
MKVSKLIEILETENQDAEVFAYLGAEQGYKVVGIGQEGGAVIGKGIADGNRSFVLLPIQVPNEFEPWEDASPYLPTKEDSSLDGTLCRNGYPIDECKCC